LSARRRVGALLAGAAVAVAVGLLAWPSLPPVNNDEYLPLLPKGFLGRPAEARSAAASPSVRDVFGIELPAQVYAYVGSLKGLLYSASGLSAEVETHRAVNLVLLAGAFALLAEAALALSGGSLAALALLLAFLAGDLSLVVLGICDEGPIVLGLLLAAALLRLTFGLVVAPSARPRATAVAIALLAALGVWDRLNFLWYVGAFAAGGLAAALLRGAPRRGLLAIGGMAAGSATAFVIAPGFLHPLAQGLDARLPWSDGERVLAHVGRLASVADPFGAYHRYVEMEARLGDPWLAAYRLLLLAGTAAAVLAGCALAARGHSTPVAAGLMLSALSVALLVVALVSTSHSWASHHVAPLRPFAFLLIALALARHPDRGLPAGLLLAAIFAGVGVHGLVLLRAAPPLQGVYGVTWNAVDAWRAAVRSEARLVLALDWGVFYPGVANSPATQRWEATEESDAERLWGMVHGQPEIAVGLLYRSDGPHAVEAAARRSPNVEVVSARRFDASPGDAWSLLLVRARDRDAPLAEPPGDGLLPDLEFAAGAEGWQERGWRGVSDASLMETVPCFGTRCLWIRHFEDADTRLEHELSIAEPGRYELSVWARTTGVPFERKGARLLFSYSPETPGPRKPIESVDLRGMTAWQRLRLYFGVPAGGTRARIELRLGDFGAPTQGEAWFAGARLRREP